MKSTIHTYDALATPERNDHAEHCIIDNFIRGFINTILCSKGVCFICLLSAGGRQESGHDY
jgi:hypothetical protein